MRAFSVLFSTSSSSCLWLLIVVALFHGCLSNENSNNVLCSEIERQALLQFKHGLIDRANRLASWDREENDCCKWAGIVCDNFTGHIHQIHLAGVDGHCSDDYSTASEYEEASKQMLSGKISPSLLYLKQLKYLDLSCNEFGGIQIPSFVGSLGNLRHLNLSHSGFGGSIPHQLGNLSTLHVLCLGSFYGDSRELTRTNNMQWLSSLRLLHHLDMSGVDLSKALDWVQVIRTLPSLVELHLSRCRLSHIDPHLTSVNISSLSLLDLSGNHFNNSLVPGWIFRITSLISLDLSWCNFRGPIPSGDGFHNLTSLKMLHVSGNDLMNSSVVLEGLSSLSSSLILLDIRYCGLSSSVLGDLKNLTSLLSLDLSENQLTKKIPQSLGNLCNLRRVDLALNDFGEISLTNLLASFFECKSPKLETLSFESSRISSHLPDQLGRLLYLVNLQLGYNFIAGPIPDSIGQLSLLRSLDLDSNLISGTIPYSIGRLSSLEFLDLSYNQLNGSLPDSLGLLSELEFLDVSYNLLTGVVTEAHFLKLSRLRYLIASRNNLALNPHLVNWVPSFQLVFLDLNSWNLGTQFPSWLFLQRQITYLDIGNTGISYTMPKSFWSSFSHLQHFNMSHNHIMGRLFSIPASLLALDLSSNCLSGSLPELSNGSSILFLDLSNNSFSGSLHPLLCHRKKSQELLEILDLSNNQLSGVIPECWVKWPSLSFLNLENNHLSGGIPRTWESLSSLQLLNLCKNKLSGGLSSSLMNMTGLQVLLLAGNKFGGRIPTWLGRQLVSLRVLKLRSNNFVAEIPHELCSLTSIQILDLSHNNLSGNIPKCFNSFRVLAGKEISPIIEFPSIDDSVTLASASLVIKGREDTYSTILGLVTVLDLSSNNFSGHIPNELIDLQALQSLNLSRNHFTGRIPERIGYMKALESLDLSLNRLSGEIPMSLSSLSFLSSLNLSSNCLTGRIPTSTQLQSLNGSSFYGNRLCGAPLNESCGVLLPDDDDKNGGPKKGDDNGSIGADWGLIVSIVLGFVVGFWVVVAPLTVSRSWRIAYFRFLNLLRLHDAL